jgi:acetyl esterase/lipase
MSYYFNKPKPITETEKLAFSSKPNKMSTNQNITYQNDTKKADRYLCHRIIYLFVLLQTTVVVIDRVHSVPIIAEKIHSRSREPITLEEAFLGELRAKDFYFDWLSTREVGNNEIHDQLIYDDSRNILLVTLPSIDRRNGSNLASSSSFATKNSQTPTNFKPNVTVLMPNSSVLSSIEFQGYKLSPSQRYLLLWNSRRKLFRHSSTAKYFIYDIKLDLITILSTKPHRNQSAANGSFSPEDDNEYTRFKVVDWYSTATPDGLVDSLLVIQNNDIYNFYDISKLAREPNTHSNYFKGNPVPTNNALPIRLTDTGREGIVFNGVPDWLYEEEILGDTPAFQVSPLSSHLAYMSFDDSTVNIMPFTVYGDRIIPRVQLIRYPKAGQPNPRVTVYIVENFNQLDDAQSKPNSVRLTLPDDLGREQHYINRINWLTNDKLALVWSSRNQSTSIVVVCSMHLSSSARWKCEKNLHLNAEKGWLDINDDLLPLNADHYLALIPKFEGADVGYFKHIAKVSLREPDNFVYLTSGPKEVISFNGIDYERSLVYYTSTVANQPGQRQLFVTELNISTQPNVTPNNETGEAGTTSVCVTCDHHPGECLYNMVKMSPSTNYYMFHCSGPDVPRTELRATRRRRHRNFFENLVNDTRRQKLLGPFEPADSAGPTGDGSNNQSSPSLLWTYEDNKILRNKLENIKSMPLTLRVQVPIPSTEYLADVLLLIPPGFVGTAHQAQQQLRSSKYLTLEQVKQFRFTPSNEGQQFPMVVDVYGGPGSQKVDYRFNINLGHYLASSKQIVYAMIDGRGSGYQGSKRLYELYHRLGTVEIQDQINVASQLAHSLRFIDPARVAIWGWSYGGYAAAMSLAQSRSRANNEPPNSSKLVQTNSSDYDTMSEGIFKCAVSVAPVTNWIYYDTAYTEKYMSSPWLNEKYDELYPGDHNRNDSSNDQPMLDQQYPKTDPLEANTWTSLNRTLKSAHIQPHLTQQLFDLIATSGTNKSQRTSSTNQPVTSQTVDLNERYRKASLLEQAAGFESNGLLLIHGTADDNVNFQQSIMLMKRLIKKNILFDTRLYPDQDHGIAEKADKLHLGSTITNFLVGCLG